MVETSTSFVSKIQIPSIVVDLPPSIENSSCKCKGFAVYTCMCEINNDTLDSN